jgi:AbrB family looped-hinge helix DNA binding protein
MSTLTAKGQTTIPVQARRRLGLKTGDRLLFTVAGDQLVVRKADSFLALAGAVEVPPERRGGDWDAVLAQARAERGAA